MIKLNSQYESVKEFKQLNPRDYKRLQSKGLIKTICDLYGWEYRETKPSGWWNEERITQDIEDNNIDSVKKWKKLCNPSLRAAQKLGIYEKLSSNMKKEVVRKKKPLPRNHWTEENIRKDALKDTKQSDWNKRSPGAVRKARKLGIIEDVTKHMKK